MLTTTIRFVDSLDSLLKQIWAQNHLDKKSLKTTDEHRREEPFGQNLKSINKVAGLKSVKMRSFQWKLSMSNVWDEWFTFSLQSRPKMSQKQRQTCVDGGASF